MNGLFRRAGRRLANWLEGELERRRRLAAGHGQCIVGLGSQLLPEAEVSNLGGRREAIRLGDNTFVRGRLLTYAHAGRIRVGDWCFIGPRTEIWSMDSITIGDRVLISHGVNINDSAGHSMNAVERHAHFRHIIERGHPLLAQDLPGVDSAPIVIEDDVWISFGVTILRGVRLGKGCVIAANSLVTQDVPPGMLYRNEVRAIIAPLGR